MNVNFELNAVVRQDMGKGASRRLRRLQDAVPAVIYGAGKAAHSISFNHSDILNALKNEAFYSHILTLHIDGKAEKVILKDLQRHPYKARILHMDFLRIDEKQKLHMHIPFHFINEDKAPGVKEGGIISHNMKDVEITCLPKDLPEFVEVDMSKLGLDEIIHLSQLTAPKGVDFVAISHGDDPAIAAIHRPRVEQEETTVVTTEEETPAETPESSTGEE